MVAQTAAPTCSRASAVQGHKKWSPGAGALGCALDWPERVSREFLYFTLFYMASIQSARKLTSPTVAMQLGKEVEQMENKMAA